MKTLTAFFAFSLILNLSITAQNNIRLDINHMLGDEAFEFFQTADQASFVFEVDRLEYYVSDISITHDGGTVTDIENVWLLVDASSEETQNLGSWNIEQVESISFHIGVGPDVNNEDPTQWPITHPLYPQLPSMHWGWASGYRFVAMEGLSGASQPDQVFEIHALGNDLYFQTSIDVAASASDGEVVIPIVADYVKALESMNLASGTITHGSWGDAITLLENFRDEVFSAGTVTSSSTSEFNGVWRILPNPSTSQAMLVLELPISDSYFLNIRDIKGRIIHNENLLMHSGRVLLPQVDTGVYLVELVDGERVITSTRWVAQ